MEPNDKQRVVCGNGDLDDTCMVFEGTLEELAPWGSPLTLVGFSLEHRESPVSEQAHMEAEGSSGDSPGGENQPRDEFIFDQE